MTWVERQRLERLTAEGAAVLDEALAWIEEHPEEHSQGSWYALKGRGTTMCVAGVIAMLAGAIPAWDDAWLKVRLPDGTEVATPTFAAERLQVGEDGDIATALFYKPANLERLRWYRAEYGPVPEKPQADA